MEHFKRVISLLLALFIAVSPLLADCSFSYAEDIDWQNCTTQEEMVAAFKAYCRSRNISIKKMSGLTQYSVTSLYRLIADASEFAGLDLNKVQTELKYKIDNDGFLKFLYTQSGISYLNRIFSAFALQNNLVIVDHSPFNKALYNDEVWTDYDGDSAVVFVAYNNFSAIDYDVVYPPGETDLSGSNYIRKTGTYYKYHPSIFLTYPNGSYISAYRQTQNGTSNNYQIVDGSIVSAYNPFTWKYKYFKIGNMPTNPNRYQLQIFDFEPKNNAPDLTEPPSAEGYLCVVRRAVDNSLRRGVYCQYDAWNNENQKFDRKVSLWIDTSSQLSADNLSGSSGDISSDDPIPFPKDGPAVVTPKNKNTDEPYQTINNYINDSFNDNSVTNVTNEGDNNDNDITFPIGVNIDANGNINFKMPKISDIAPHGFSISGLLQKFPFCIPLDIYAMIDLLDADPVTPQFQTNVRFSTFNYDLNIDLSDYDTIMEFVRKLFLILYIFGILMITPYIVK